ncbi:MAG: DUF4185 domain-containing protein [Saprospiraceae bacterium]|nr:DUF4185 domain-containing protein [Saprospiraceae bacterium]
MRTNSFFLRIIFIGALFTACDKEKNDGNDLLFTVKEAPEWTQLFIRTDGWFGGDGIFAIPMHQDTSGTGKQLIIFSDTMLGKIKNGTLQKGYHMVNNSVAFLEGKNPDTTKISFPVPQDSAGKDVSLFPVLLDGEDGEYFWLGDGFCNPANGNTYIFAYRIIDRPEWTHTTFKFEVLGGALIVLPQGSTFPFPDQYQLPLPFFSNDDGKITSFGVAVFEDTNPVTDDTDGYIYIYGTRDPHKEVLTGRVKAAEFEAFDRWTFWNGSDWVTDFLQAQAIADSASNELSVTPLPNGEYALISQLNSIYPTVIMRTGKKPWGPFGKITELWDCQPDLAEPEFFAYNAKAHPSLSEPGELLVSYNINSFAFWDQIEKHPHLYRPRFFKLVFEE